MHIRSDEKSAFFFVCHYQKAKVFSLSRRHELLDFEIKCSEYSGVVGFFTSRIISPFLSRHFRNFQYRQLGQICLIMVLQQSTFQIF